MSERVTLKKEGDEISFSIENYDSDLLNCDFLLEIDKNKISLNIGKKSDFKNQDYWNSHRSPASNKELTPESIPIPSTNSMQLDKLS